ncbi:MAG TPA: ribosome small subunit-dependent GTPase A [bacterium]|nr:ribosome small subunit-dependent GTPase A [bacterium]
MAHTLDSLGWGPSWAAQVGAQESGLLVGRAAFESRGIYHVLLDQGGLLNAELKGILRKGASGHADYPVVGDWVLLERLDDRRGRILRCLPRRNAIVRREQSRREADRRASSLQILAANVDWGLITTSLNEEFNPRRLERYLVLVRESGAQPAILLTKSDLPDDGGAEALEAARAVAGGTPVLLLSVPNGRGIREVRDLLGPHSTAVLLGSSGVGKSTLVNALLGEDTMATAEIREKDSRGRHTTVGRHLLPLPWGGCLIDSPGLRDLGLSDEGGVEASFEDIALLAATCRFSDCGHSNEPGCAVLAALQDGSLDPDRYDNYLKLRLETAQAQLKRELGTERYQRQKGKYLGGKR